MSGPLTRLIDTTLSPTCIDVSRTRSRRSIASQHESCSRAWLFGGSLNGALDERSWHADVLNHDALTVAIFVIGCCPHLARAQAAPNTRASEPSTAADLEGKVVREIRIARVCDRRR